MKNLISSVAKNFVRIAILIVCTFSIILTYPGMMDKDKDLRNNFSMNMKNVDPITGEISIKEDYEIGNELITKKDGTYFIERDKTVEIVSTPYMTEEVIDGITYVELNEFKYVLKKDFMYMVSDDFLDTMFRNDTLSLFLKKDFVVYKTTRDQIEKLMESSYKILAIRFAILMLLIFWIRVAFILIKDAKEMEENIEEEVKEEVKEEIKEEVKEEIKEEFKEEVKEEVKVSSKPKLKPARFKKEAKEEEVIKEIEEELKDKKPSKLDIFSPKIKKYTIK